jgi:hypothetical protein
VPLLHVAPKALRQVRAKRHDSTLAEFRLSNEQRVAGEIGIRQLESRRFTDSQPQS